MAILSHTGADAKLFADSDPDEGMIKYSHGSDMLQFLLTLLKEYVLKTLVMLSME